MVAHKLKRTKNEFNTIENKTKDDFVKYGKKIQILN